MEDARIKAQTVVRGWRGAWCGLPRRADGFFVVDVELGPCAFRHAAITMRETFWPESVSREVKRK